MDDITQQIVDSAQKAVALCNSRSGDEVDFTEPSLSIVEEMLAEAAQYASDLSAGQLLGLVQQFGCYILEVGRREFGGRYLWHDQRDQPILVVGEPKFRIAIITWDKVRGRIGGDEGDNIPFFYAGFAERVRKAKPGEDALYV
ncbi:MAG: hypothetical protein QM703_06780 [Gemmatales bacterium]